MNLKLERLEKDETLQFKLDMQEAFQKGYEDILGKTDKIILPFEDIEHSLNFKNSVAYKAVMNGKMIGGAIVVINKETLHNDLHFLYVKVGNSSKGIGKMIWDKIEKMYPETKVWETCTPYFEKRNVYFYVNKCNFYITKYEKDDVSENERSDGMVVLKKFMDGSVNYENI